MDIAEVCAVMAEGTRRDILSSLAQEHKAVGQLVEELGVSQPTVSKHLRVLREAGVVTMRAQGQKRFYSINTEPLVAVSAWLHGLGAGHVDPAQLTVRAQQLVAEQQAAAEAQAAEARSAAAVARAAAHTAARSAAGTAPTPQRLGPPAAPLAPRPGAELSVPSEGDASVQQHISRSVGRAATKAADLLANLPTFRRRKD